MDDIREGEASFEVLARVLSQLCSQHGPYAWLSRLEAYVVVCCAMLADNGALLVKEGNCQKLAKLITASAGTAVSYLTISTKAYVQCQKPNSTGNSGQRKIRCIIYSQSADLCLQVIMSSTLLHASLPNNSSSMRRAWMPQFSARPICHKSSSIPLALAVPISECL